MNNRRHIQRKWQADMKDDASGIKGFKYRLHALQALLKSIESDLDSAGTGVYAPDTFDVAYNSKLLIENTLNLVEQYCWLWSQLPEEKLKELDIQSYKKLMETKVNKTTSCESYVSIMPGALQGLEANLYKILERLKTRYSYETAEEFKKSMRKGYAEKRQEDKEERLDW